VQERADVEVSAQAAVSEPVDDDGGATPGGPCLFDDHAGAGGLAADAQVGGDQSTEEGAARLWISPKQRMMLR
jgi:hypothetical protein